MSFKITSSAMAYRLGRAMALVKAGRYKTGRVGDLPVVIFPGFRGQSIQCYMVNGDREVNESGWVSAFGLKMSCNCMDTKQRPGIMCKHVYAALQVADRINIPQAAHALSTTGRGRAYRAALTSAFHAECERIGYKPNAEPEPEPVRKPAPVHLHTPQIITCDGITKAGKPCLNQVKVQGDYCRLHKDQMPQGRACVGCAGCEETEKADCPYVQKAEAEAIVGQIHSATDARNVLAALAEKMHAMNVNVKRYLPLA